MDMQTQNEVKPKKLERRTFNSGFISDSGNIMIHPDLIQPTVAPAILQLSRDERMKLAVRELRIGQRIYDELKIQGRSVAWLADQLSMERSSLYYCFHRNSIDLEYLMCISCLLGHDFLKDVTDVLKAYGLCH